MKHTTYFLQKKAKDIRKKILTLSYNGHGAHISSSLSVADILCVLYWEILRIKKHDDKQRDRFILSKGHAACALYAVLLQKKIITSKLAQTYGQNGTLLGVHPEKEVSGIEFSTGSLGHGLSVGAGMAVAGKTDGKKYKIFVLLSDAECQEGQVWEAAMFAGFHSLNNLIAIIDNNHMQAMGKTKSIIELEPLAKKWETFGWETREIDGHNLEELISALSTPSVNKPTVIICNTVAGKGISFMQDKLEWHYHNLDRQLYKNAIKEIDRT